MTNVTNAVYQRLYNNAGKIFLIKDLVDLADKSTIRSILSRLTKQGKISRIMNGMYVKLRVSKLLNKTIYPSPIDVAYKLAEKFNWDITVTENEARNKTGLDTQVVNSYVFCVTGKSNKYYYDNREIVFHHIDKRFISDISKEFSILLQAIKTLDKKDFTKKNKLILSRFRKDYVRENILDKKYNFPKSIFDKLFLIDN